MDLERGKIYRVSKGIFREVGQFLDPTEGVSVIIEREEFLKYIRGEIIPAREMSFVSEREMICTGFLFLHMVAGFDNFDEAISYMIDPRKDPEIPFEKLLEDYNKLFDPANWLNCSKQTIYEQLGEWVSEKVSNAYREWAGY